MNHRATRVSRTIAVAVAGAAVGLVTTFAVANGTDRGNDPRSYHPAERAAIADWANDVHLSGLSPASLSATRSPNYTWTPQMTADMQAIADYAREHELTGLSPESLQPTGD